MRFQFDSKLQKFGAIVGALFIVSSPAYGIFGIGDIVFDPTSYATLAPQLTEAVQILENGIQMYNLAMQEATYLESKNVFQAVGLVAAHVGVANLAGETNGWDAVLTTATSPGAATGAWQTASNPLTSLQARINLADSMGAEALMVIGSCNQNAQQNDISITSLESEAMSGDGLANTAAALGNIQNMGQTEALRTQQCQHAMENERLKQMSLETLRYRDLESQSLTTFQTIDTYYATNSVGMTDVSTALNATIY
jgi:hypothetical protein